MSSITLPELADLDGLGGRDLQQLLRQVEQVRRQVEVLAAEIVGVADRSGVFADDGHATVAGWARATCNWSTATSRAMVQTSRLLHATPEARVDEIGVDQLRLLARVHGNGRCRDQFAGSAGLLVRHARSLWFDEFAVVARRWEALADADGAHRAHDHAHHHRHAHVSIVGEHVYLDARGGVLDGAELVEVFEHFRHAEFETDWQAGLDTHGEAMRPALMARSEAQRRFDALHTIFTTAATAQANTRVDPLVNIVIDQHSFEHHLQRLTGADVEPLDPTTVDQRRCETITGHQLDPDDVIAAALIGHVRRVVLDSRGVVIDLGRKRRLFTRSSRDAVLLGDRWCLWPGCNTRSQHCHTDHTQPWTAGGPTRPANAGPLCPHHNRWKQHGYHTWRDQGGQWHVTRPDGTHIAEPNAPPQPLAGT